MADIVESLKRQSVPLSIVAVLLSAVAGGALAWATVKNAVAANAETIEQQERELEIIKKQANEAARQRTRIETNQRNIERLLEKLDDKLDRLD